MRKVSGLFVLLLLSFVSIGLGETSTKASKTVEGVVVDVGAGAHEISMTIRSGGVEYQFCVACRGSASDSPKVVGGDANVIGTRVRVTFTSLYRNKQGKGFYGKASRIVVIAKP